jgi:Flp pilus assembly protein TadD
MARAHYVLGLVYRDSQEPAKAVASLQRAVTFDPNLLAAREELADLDRALGRPEDEKAQLVALSAADARLPRSLALALAEGRAGQFGAARATLAAIDATSPGDSRIAIALGRLYLARAERGDDADAVSLALAALETALSGTARRSEGLALYGRAMFLAGDIRGAERLLQQAVLTTPVVTEAFAYLADAAERLGDPTEARDALLRLDALEGDTALPAIRTARARRIGSLALDAGDPTTAARFLAGAVADGHADAQTLGLYSRARWALGDRAGARQTLTQALARDPHDNGLLSLSRSFK